MEQREWSGAELVADRCADVDQCTGVDRAATGTASRMARARPVGVRLVAWAASRVWRRVSAPAATAHLRLAACIAYRVRLYAYLATASCTHPAVCEQRPVRLVYVRLAYVLPHVPPAASDVWRRASNPPRRHRHLRLPLVRYRVSSVMTRVVPYVQIEMQGL